MRIPIVFKVSAMILATILATSGLLTWFFLDFGGSELRAQLNKRGQSIARNLSNMVASLLLGNEKDKDLIRVALNKVQKDDLDIAGVTVVDADGLVVADSRPIRQGKPFYEPGLALQNRTEGGSQEDSLLHRISFFQPSTYQNTRVGWVVVYLSLDALDQAQEEASSRVFFITAVIACVMILLGFLLLRGMLTPLRLVLDGTRRISTGDFSTRIEVRSRDEIGDLAQAFNGMAARTELFFRYLDKGIVERLAQDESLAHPGGYMRAASVLFGDMRGFTALSNQRAPSEVVSILNTYYDLFFEVVHHYDGVVDKTMGDAIMAFFESARSIDVSHSRRATMAAVAMRAAVWVLRRTIQDAARQGIAVGSFEPQEFGFAVATGRLIVGNIGTDRHLDYTVCGPAVNLASRLQDETTGGELVLDRFSAMDVDDLVVCRQLGQVQPKGFSESQRVTPYQVVALRPNEWIRLQPLMEKIFSRKFFADHFLWFLTEQHGGKAPDTSDKLIDSLGVIAKEIYRGSDPLFLVG